MATKAKAAPRVRPGAQRKRPAAEAAPDLAQTVSHAAIEVAGAVRSAVLTSVGAALEASTKVAATLAAENTLKKIVGRALVTGGRALIDPRAAVGEVALRLGEGLLEDADRLRWFVVRLDEAGKATTFGFGTRADAQTFYDTTRKAFPRQYLCESIAGPGR